MDVIRSGFLNTSLWLVVISAISATVNSAVLPEDAADVLYHRYEGGGMVIDGPSVLVRKSIGNNTSIYANYYVDTVSSASVDVIATASPYKEEREEYSLGVDLLNQKTIVSLGYTQSDENDFNAKSAYLDITQDVFGDLTTVGLGLSKGWDKVGKTGAAEFSEDVDRLNIRLSMSQIITKNFILSGKYELITDEGFLNNPYRKVRYLTEDGSAFEYQPEEYPDTRTSNAYSILGAYYLPYRAALKAEYRYFTDSWGIDSHTASVEYIHPYDKHWVFDFKYRYYQQQQADFYSDLFPYVDAQNNMARDKEMSSFSSNSLGIGITYGFTGKDLDFGGSAKNGNKQASPALSWIKKGDFALLFDVIMFDYENFRDVTKTGFQPGQEPLYEFNARVTRLLLTVWF